MELTPAHLRYLLAIYEVSQPHLDISSRSIAEKLGVTKPSVVRVMNLLMERGMIVKEYYGKIFFTARGIFVAREVKKNIKKNKKKSGCCSSRSITACSSSPSGASMWPWRS